MISILHGLIYSGLYDPALGPVDYHVKCPTCYRNFDVSVFALLWCFMGRIALAILVTLSWNCLYIIQCYFPC